ncbi:unnamed protein product [Absidia cylindrospora]
MFDSVLRLYSERYQVDPVALNCFFLRKTEMTAIIIEIKDIKVNRKGYCVTQATIKQTKSSQPGQAPLQQLEDYHAADYVDKVLGVFTMGNMDNEQGASSDHDLPAPPNNGDRQLAPFSLFYMKELIEMEVDAASLPDPTTIKPMEVHQTIRFRDQRPVDFKSIPFWCDNFVSPPNLLGPVFDGPLWCATMQMEVQFKRKCPEGLKKVAASFVTHTLKNSRFDIDGWIWGDNGELLATTRHQCLCLPWERNTTKSRL